MVYDCFIVHPTVTRVTFREFEPKPCTVISYSVSEQRSLSFHKQRMTTDQPSWTTVRTTSMRWEAEFMQQVLAAQQIPSRIIDHGVPSYMGMGSPATLQVPSPYLWSARLLLSPVEEEST